MPSLCRPLPRGAVRNDWANSRARGARICMRAPVCLFRNRHTGSRTPLRGRPTGPGPTCFQAEPTTEAVFACVPHAMDFTACCMSQGLSLLPTLPVRSNCRPDLHLGRLPVLPACVPHPLSRIVIPVGVRSPASWRTTASRCHATNTLAARPLTERDVHKIFLLGIKSKNKICCCEAM